MTFRYLAIVLLFSSMPVAAPAQPVDDAAPLADSTPFNETRLIGTHNSFRPAFSVAQEAIIGALDPDRAYRLGYGHRPLTEQLDAGVRFVELDLYRDPKGGEFSSPLIRQAAIHWGLPAPPRPPAAVMSASGIKVLHSPDDDYVSNCWTLEACLLEIKTWSDKNPHHTPVIVNFELKPPTPSLYFEQHPEHAVRVPFDKPALDRLDAVLRSEFAQARAFYPAELGKSGQSLREAALSGSWPTLGELRGNVIFLLLETNYYAAVRKGEREDFVSPVLSYVEDDPRERAMFVLARNPEAGYAAFVKPDLDVEQDNSAIRSLVRGGQIVQVRTESFEKLRRSGEERCDAAVTSNAQILVSDFPWSLPSIHPSYKVQPPISGVLSPGESPCVAQTQSIE